MSSRTRRIKSDRCMGSIRTSVLVFLAVILLGSFIAAFFLISTPQSDESSTNVAASHKLTQEDLNNATMVNLRAFRPGCDAQLCRPVLFFSPLELNLYADGKMAVISNRTKTARCNPATGAGCWPAVGDQLEVVCESAGAWFSDDKGLGSNGWAGVITRRNLGPNDELAYRLDNGAKLVFVPEVFIDPNDVRLLKNRPVCPDVQRNP